MFRLQTPRAGIARLAMILAVVLGLGACVGFTRGDGLPPGEYVTDDGQERITVGDSGSIRFQVRVEGNKSVEMTDREFGAHQVWSRSQTIRPQPLTNNDALYGIGKYTWLWKYGKIAKISKSGQVLAWFTPKSQTQPPREALGPGR